MPIKRLLGGFSSILLCVLFTQISFAQTKSISGKVLDDKGSPIQGATVTVKGSRTGTATDASGTFKLNVAANAKTLVVSSVGFGSKELEIGSQTSFDVSLVQQGATLGDVVVTTGYGTAKKKDLTGAIENVSSKDFNQGVMANPIQQVQGKVSGLLITQPGGDPNQNPIIRLRGQTSLTGSQTPLIVVDGVPLDEAAQIANIPAGDIESYDVLKDASATAIYGARGANGVIIINTKRGHSGRVQIDYNGYVGEDKVAKKYPFMNLQQWKTASQNLLVSEQDPNTGTTYTPAGADSIIATYDKGGNTDWQDAVLRTATTTNHTLSISGGTGGFNYRGSITYLDQQGVVINSGKQQYGLRFNASQKAMNDKLDISLGIVNTVTNRHYTDYGIFAYIYTAPPSYPVYNNNNPADGFFIFSDFSEANPVEHQSEEIMTGKETFNQEYGTVNYELFKGLKIGTTGSISSFNTVFNNFTPAYPQPENTFATASDSYGNSTTPNNYSEHGDLHINYAKQFGEHNLTLTGVYEYNDYKDDWFSASGNQYIVPQEQNNNLGAGNPSNNGVGSYKDEYKIISFLARATYNYAGKYYVTASFRDDGSSKFGANNRWGKFPSASIAWRLSQEEFLKDVSWLSDLKLRAGYGVTGNSDAISPYNTQLIIGPNGRYFDPSNSSYEYPPAYSIGQNANPNLKWEERVGRNIGVDFALLNSRFTGTINYFSDKTNNLLYNYTVPVPPFYVPTILANVGSLTNKGVEFSVSAQIVKGLHFNWTANGQITFSHTKVTSLNGTYDGYPLSTDNIPGGYAQGRGLSSNPITYLKVGYSPYVFALPHYMGVDKSGNQLFDSAGVKAINIETNGNPTLYYTDPSPKFNYGLQNTFSYDNWSLNFFLRGVVGQKLFNNTELDDASINRLPGNNAFTEAPYTGIKDAPVASDLYLQKAGFLRLDNLTIGYTFNKIEGLQSLRVFASGNNLFVITPYKGLDPEVQNGDTNQAYIDASYGGLGYYFKTRSVSVGVNLSLK
jgi:TonB-linked SusC/RagA family outer membrane protein